MQGSGFFFSLKWILFLLLYLFTWYKRNHRNNHLLLSAHLLYKKPANLESYLAFSAKPKGEKKSIKLEYLILDPVLAGFFF